MEKTSGTYVRLEKLPCWNKNDPRLLKIRRIIEIYDPSGPSNPSVPSCSSVLEALGTRRTRLHQGFGGQARWTREETEIIVNYLIDLNTRSNYLIDRQIDAVEEKHRTEGGYNENLLKRRLEYKKNNQ